jgi:hypothetical protein
MAAELMQQLQETARSADELEQLVEGATDRLYALKENAEADQRHGIRYQRSSTLVRPMRAHRSRDDVDSFTVTRTHNGRWRIAVPAEVVSELRLDRDHEALGALEVWHPTYDEARAEGKKIFRHAIGVQG